MNISSSTVRHVGVGLSAVVLAVLAAFALDSASLQASAGGRGGFGGGPPGVQGGFTRGQGQGPANFGLPTGNGSTQSATNGSPTNRTTR